MTPQRQAGLDTVMPEAEGKPGAKQSSHPTEMHFPLTNAPLTTCMHSQSPVHNKFLKLSIKQFSPLFDH